MSKDLFDDIHHIALVVYDANKTASYFEMWPWSLARLSPDDSIQERNRYKC